MAVTLLLVSFVSFIIVQAAPGDYAEIYAAKKAATGAIITQADIEAMRRRARSRQALVRPILALALRHRAARRLRLQLGSGGGRSAR